MVIPLRDENPTRRAPILTLALIAANVIVFFFVQPHALDVNRSLSSDIEEQRFLYEHAAIPCEVRQLEPLTLIEIATGDCLGGSREALTQEFPDKSVLFSVLASMFMHGGLLHIGGNMLFLWIFGNNVEDRFGYVGFAAFYVFAGVVATAAHVVLNLDSTVPLVGASGAIAGVMGAYLVFFPHARILSLVPIFLFIQIIRLPASVVLGLWFVMQFFTNPNSGVAWAAHVGGFVIGAAIALLLRPSQPESVPQPNWP